MTMPTWWSERRFGVFIHATVASVPGWAPIGEHAELYQRHLGEVHDSSGQTGPLVEVLAHHRDRWGHVEQFDDFVPLLTYERFDADAWARLVSDAGAGYSVAVARHHDGWTWWDAPGATRPITEDGPRRDVLTEYAAACRRHGIALGTYYSFLDWGEPQEPGDHSDEDLRDAQVVDLVGRHGSVMVWGDIGCGRDPDPRTTQPLLDRLRSIDPQVVVNDRWIAPSASRSDDAPPVVRTFASVPPDEITDGPWELSAALGHSFGYNRAERTEHLMTGLGIVALYTEVLAKGGNLLLHVGPDAEGSIPPLFAEPLRIAGHWIRRFGPLIASTTPWSRWGDADARYLDDDGDVIVIDIAGSGTFAALPSSDVKVTAVGLVDGRDHRELSWHQDADGLHVMWVATDATLAPDPEALDVAAYRVTVEAPDRPEELFAPVDPAPIQLAPLLVDARPGDIVQLGDGVYAGPAAVPDGVVLRGLGPNRTTITRTDHDAGSDADEETENGPTLSIGADARLEHVCVTGGMDPRSVDGGVVAVTAAAATLLGCTIAGRIDIDADDVLLRAVTARCLRARNSDRLHVSRCELTGGPRDVGIDLRGGGGHHVESNRLAGHLCSVRVSETTGTTIRGNTLSGRRWAVHLDHCESAHVHGNRISRTMRAVDIDGGTQAVVDGNAVTDGDSGCVVEDGASDCEVYGNHWDRCRIGLLAWDAVSLHHQDNVASSLHDPESAFVTGP